MKLYHKFLKLFSIVSLATLGGLLAPAKALAAPNLTVIYLSASDSDQSWDESTSAKAGEDVYFYLELHNTNVPSLAEDVKIRVDGFGKTNITNFSSTAYYSASNAGTVTDATTVAFNKAVNIGYVPGSARMTWDVNGDGNYEYNGTQISDNIFKDGLVLGDQEGCNPYIIQISFTAHTEEYQEEDHPHLVINKQVSYGDERDNGRWYDAIAKDKRIFGSNDSFYYHILVENTGNVTIEDVKLEDRLPSYLYWVSGNGSFESGSNLVTADLGDLSAGAKITVEYQVKVKEVLPSGERTQENVVTVESDNYDDLSDSTVVWIKGPQIVTTIVEEEPEEVKKLPETGAHYLLINLILAAGSLVTGLGFRKLEKLV
ncbi:MAG: hypothetical protein ABH814_04025 [bacterium]